MCQGSIFMSAVLNFVSQLFLQWKAGLFHFIVKMEITGDSITLLSRRQKIVYSHIHVLNGALMWIEFARI